MSRIVGARLLILGNALWRTDVAYGSVFRLLQLNDWKDPGNDASMLRSTRLSWVYPFWGPIPICVQGFVTNVPQQHHEHNPQGGIWQVQTIEQLSEDSGQGRTDVEHYAAFCRIFSSRQRSFFGVKALRDFLRTKALMVVTSGTTIVKGGILFCVRRGMALSSVDVPSYCPQMKFC